MMPTLLQELAFVFPAYPLGQPSLAAPGQIDIDWGPPVGMLLLYTVIYLQWAARGLRRSKA